MTLKVVRAFCSLVAVAVVAIAPLAAQNTTDARRVQATRAELEALLKDGSLSEDQAGFVQRRLTEGDFQPGDRIVLAVRGESTLSDTFMVRSGPALELPNMPELSLRGVLRSEAEERVARHVAQFIRDPDVEVEPLIRIAVLGFVSRPGFYTVPAEIVASDAIMVAGGPGGNGDVRRTVIRRNGVELLTREEVQQALAQGKTLDQLNLQGGDEIVVGERSQGLRGTLQTAGLISGAIFGIVALASLF